MLENDDDLDLPFTREQGIEFLETTSLCWMKRLEDGKWIGGLVKDAIPTLHMRDGSLITFTTFEEMYDAGWMVD